MVKFMGIPRQHAGTGRVEFITSENKLKDVLRRVVDAYNLTNVILTRSGDVVPYARVLVNGRSFQFVGGMDAELHEGDSLALIYPWLGHENF